jgi:hypothetical protein
MSVSTAAWRGAFAAVALAIVAGFSLDPVKAQDATDEMQRAKAALSAALRDRVATEQKRAETLFAPAPSPAPAPAGAAAPAPIQAEPAAPARATVAEAEPAPAAPPRHRPELRERPAPKAHSRVASRRGASPHTRVARHRSNTHMAAAEDTGRGPRREMPDPASAATDDFPVTTGSLGVQPAAAMSNPHATALALPASLAPTVPTLGSSEPSMYREGVGWIRGTQAALNALQQPLTGGRRARTEIVAACRDAIVPAAVAQGASEVYAAGTARARSGRNGTVAPLEVRILYKGLASQEVRQASVTCELDRAGQVVALSDATGQPALR